MAIEKRSAINIEEVGNGFIVTASHRHEAVAVDSNNVMVFNTVRALNRFIKEHFGPARKDDLTRATQD